MHYNCYICISCPCKNCKDTPNFFKFDKSDINIAKIHKESLLRGRINTASNESIKLQLSVYLFEEDEYTIAYCLALDLSGYGKNEDEANADLQAVLTEYILYTTHKKTIREDLQNLGWIVKKSIHKKMTPPSDENFNHIVNTFPVRKINAPIYFQKLY